MEAVDHFGRCPSGKDSDKALRSDSRQGGLDAHRGLAVRLSLMSGLQEAACSGKHRGKACCTLKRSRSLATHRGSGIRGACQIAAARRALNREHLQDLVPIVVDHLDRNLPVAGGSNGRLVVLYSDRHVASSISALRGNAPTTAFESYQSTEGLSAPESDAARRSTSDRGRRGEDPSTLSGSREPERPKGGDGG